jgi:hypothetical protein
MQGVTENVGKCSDLGKFIYMIGVCGTVPFTRENHLASELGKNPRPKSLKVSALKQTGTIRKYVILNLMRSSSKALQTMRFIIKHLSELKSL